LTRLVADGLLADVSRRIRRVRMYGVILPGCVETAIDEHIETAERVVEGRLETALTLPHQHIGASLEIVVERAARALVAIDARHRGVPVDLGTS
jgi:DNA-binding GntR family transcriptional regulator